MLQDLFHYPEITSLVPFSGIQFLDFGLRAPDIQPRNLDFYDSAGKGDGAPPSLVPLETRREDGRSFFIDDQGKEICCDPTLSVPVARVLEMFQDHWIPVPFLRMEPGGRLARGPVNWARARIVAMTGTMDPVNTHRLILAFDTSLLPVVPGRPYLAPSAGDAQSGRTFSLVRDWRLARWFASEPWTEQWLFDLFRTHIENRRSTPYRRVHLTEQDTLNEMQGASGLEHIARYVCLLRILAENARVPDIALVDNLSASRPPPIDVDLVLDIGNSRTCGILVETNPDHGANLNDSYRLELRDLSAPEFCCDEPFETRAEFACPSFGKDALSRVSGRPDAFSWPGMVRVGPEASRLSSLRSGVEGNTGMLSPKRYLWDTRQRRLPWRFNTAGGGDDVESFANRGAMARFVNESGEVINGPFPPADGDTMPALRPLYSRSSLMSFVLGEILLQAIRQVNSPSHRLRRPHASQPRRICRVILTMPTALSLPERNILEIRARNAIELVFSSLGEDTAMARPEVILRWDEASATQLVYLYTEVARNFGGDARSFFGIMRRPDARGNGARGSETRGNEARGNETRGSEARGGEARGGGSRGNGDDDGGPLRIASIDIGGGTTDVIITDYRLSGPGNRVTIIPAQIFREGFNLAGDDMLLRVIQGHVLPAIETLLHDAGVAAPRDALAEMFGGDRGGQKAEHRTRRQQFADQIMAPVGLKLLSLYEDYDPLRGGDHRVLSFDDFFPSGHVPNPLLLSYYRKIAEGMGARDADFSRLSVNFDPEAIHRTIRLLVEDMLRAISEMLWRYRVDVTLLSGRPSRLPVIRALLGETLALPPDRIIPMHNYRAGHWYPFRDRQSRISDPKSTAAVGAMICALSQGRLEYFAFRSDEMRPRSTARYLGALTRDGLLREEDVILRDIDWEEAVETGSLEADFFEFHGPLSLGFRQFPNAWWPATRLYSLDFQDLATASRLKGSLPLRVILRLKRRQGTMSVIEGLEIERIEDMEGNTMPTSALALRLRTLASEEGYWLDTGVLVDG